MRNGCHNCAAAGYCIAFGGYKSKGVCPSYTPRKRDKQQ